jgi:hypothetical protein
MPTGAHSSSGGAGGAIGGGLEARILAYLATYLIARDPLPSGWSLIPAQLEELGSQTGQEIDDVGGITDRHGFVLLQSKRRLQLSDKDDSPLADVFDQVVRQFLVGIPAGEARRPIEAGRDLLIICTDGAGSARVTRDLARVVERLATYSEDLSLEDVATNENERDVLKALRHHLGVAFLAHSDNAPTRRQIRELATVLRVVGFDLDETRPDRQSAEERLRSLLEDPQQVAGAWKDLVDFGQKLRETRRWGDRQAWRNALATGGHPLGLDHLFVRDVQRLREVTTAVLRAGDPDLVITAPDATVSVRREVADQLAAIEDGFALIGAAGAGKSVLTVGLASARIANGEDVVYLRAEILRDSLSATSSELDLQHTIDRVLQGWGGSRPATLVIDGIDATRGSEASDWLPALGRSLQGTRWRIVSSVRSFDLRHSPRWQEMFPGTPLDPAHADAGFPLVRHTLVGDLTDGEIEQVAEQSALLGVLLRDAEPRLASLLRNPFNLRLAAQLIDQSADAVAAVRTRQELLHLYWRRRVADTSSHLARRHALRDLCESMVGNRRARILDPSTVVDPAVYAAVDELLHDGVLREDVQGRRATTTPVIFAHPVLFDFAVAQTCLKGDQHLYLVQRLNDDPDLAVVVRPSLDMCLADLWEDDEDVHHTSFWDVACRLSRPQNEGHPIAAIAAACAVLRERPDYENLLKLADLTAEASTKAAATMAIAYLSGATEADDVSQGDRIASAPALSQLAARLASDALATDDLLLADRARLLLFRLDRCFPLVPGAVAADVRAKGIADVMRVALLSPSDAGHERLGLRVGESLTRAAVVDLASAGPVIDQTITAATTEHWGGNVLARQLQDLRALAAVDPALAGRLALAPWIVDQVPAETTSIGESQILALSSTRQQDLEMARYGTGVCFPGLMSVAPKAATRLLLDVLKVHGRPQETERAADSRPQVLWSENLQFAAGYDALTGMVRTLVDYLVQHFASVHEDVDADSILDLLVGELTHADVWQSILEAGASSPAGLGRRLVPIFDQGELLGHPNTHPSAAHLVSAVSPLLDDEAHAGLERRLHAAKSPLDPSDERTRAIVDTLLGQLDRGRVQLDETRARLDHLDADGGAPEPPEVPYTFHPWTYFDPPPDTSGEDATPFQVAVSQLRTDLSGSISGGTDEQRAARERLRESVPALLAVLDSPDRPLDPGDIQAAVAHLLTGADRLASDETVLPGTALGNTVFGLLAMALPPDVTTEDREP